MVITGRVMSPEQINEAGFNYPMSLCSQIVTYASTLPANHQSISFLSQDQERTPAMASPVFTQAQAHHTTGAQSILDSGATRHCSGIRSDFKSLKHWLNPEPVFVANSGTSEAIGIGSIELQTSHGPVTFNNVWYAPDFGKTRLISIWELNKSGISVTFKNKQAIACNEDTGKELFRCNGQDGLYTLKLTPLSAALHTTAIPAPDNNVRGGETESED